MWTVEQIEAAILELTPDEFRKVQEWFFELDEQRWDEQIEQNIANGKLEALAQEAIAHFEAGHYQQL